MWFLIICYYEYYYKYGWCFLEHLYYYCYCCCYYYYYYYYYYYTICLISPYYTPLHQLREGRGALQSTPTSVPTSV